MFDLIKGRGSENKDHHLVELIVVAKIDIL